MRREYEPDAPNFTPRISAIVNPDGSFEMSILKHADGDRCTREFFAYEGVDEGCGYFISTYQGDGNPLPTCPVGRAQRRQQGEPVCQRRRRSDPLQ